MTISLSWWTIHGICVAMLVPTKSMRRAGRTKTPRPVYLNAPRLLTDNLSRRYSNRAWWAMVIRLPQLVLTIMREQMRREEPPPEPICTKVKIAGGRNRCVNINKTFAAPNLHSLWLQQLHKHKSKLLASLLQVPSKCHASNLFLSKDSVKN